MGSAESVQRYKKRQSEQFASFATPAQRAATLAIAIERYKKLGWKVGSQFQTRAELVGRGDRRRYLEIEPDGVLTDHLFEHGVEIHDPQRRSPSLTPTSSTAQTSNAGRNWAVAVSAIVVLFIVGAAIGSSTNKNGSSNPSDTGENRVAGQLAGQFPPAFPAPVDTAVLSRPAAPAGVLLLKDSGAGNRQTDSFVVNGSRVQVCWNVDGTDPTGRTSVQITFYIYATGQGSHPAFTSDFNVQQPGPGCSFANISPGTYFVETNATPWTRWGVTVVSA